MFKKLTGWVACSACVAVATPAWAQDAVDAKSSVSLSSAPSAQGSASTSAGASASASAPAEADSFEPYEAGYPPDNNLLELGVFGGVLFPSKKHNLLDEHFKRHHYHNSPELGARLGWYPLSWLGLEGEAMAARSKVTAGNTRAMLFSGRGDLVLQAPFAYVVPFVVGGVGKLGAIGPGMGSDTDVAWNFGLGAKFALTHALSLRLDGRDNLTAKHGGGGQAHNFEALLGLTAVIERARREPPPPPADSDHDGVLDRVDACPSEAGVAPSGCPADTDDDGVLDRDDYCPKEAGPAPKGCPIIDTDPDKDGVPLPCDQCPNEVGVKPDGCPIRDTDGDGILDDKDKCPKEPETKNGFEDEDGCPDTLPDKVKKFTGVVQGIFFDQGKATIRKQSAATLGAAVKVLLEFPSINLEISGHTSSEGDPAFNDKLSQDRADSVKQWLVERGVGAERIKTRGAGSNEPIADNKTAAGKGKNRRIEFKVLQAQ
ncbi:MAG TPA: OmpA family protein [Polyangiaceae bacterium]|nr:OmpA family protein [Polyangiaceae bacterium]